jgi:hypothetical protein
LSIADVVYYHSVYPILEKKIRSPKIAARKTAGLRRRPLQTFATVGCQVFLQAGDGHGHFVRQAPFLESRELSQAHQATHAIADCEVLVFEPSMLWTRDSIGREGAHEAPVENVEGKVADRRIKGKHYFRLLFAAGR